MSLIFSPCCSDFSPAGGFPRRAEQRRVSAWLLLPCHLEGIKKLQPWIIQHKPARLFEGSREGVGFRATLKLDSRGKVSSKASARLSRPPPACYFKDRRILVMRFFEAFLSFAATFLSRCPCVLVCDTEIFLLMAKAHLTLVSGGIFARASGEAFACRNERKTRASSLPRGCVGVPFEMYVFAEIPEFPESKPFLGELSVLLASLLFD